MKKKHPIESIGYPGLADQDRIIEMAWEDRTPFEAIEQQFGLNEAGVIALMRRSMKASSFTMWRKRVNGRVTKHTARRNDAVLRFKCSRQKIISQNRISKR
jgi:uncharacterized protein (TIGR03643 family)